MIQRPRIHVLYEHDVAANPHGCAHIRLLRPLSHPLLAEQFDIRFALDLPAEPVDLLIVERLWRADVRPEHIERLLQWCQTHAVPLLYTLDDDLLDLRQDEPWQIFPQPYHRLLVAQLARAACLLVVTTNALSERFAPLAKCVEVVPNYLDERLYVPPADPGDDLLRFGYMGTYTHLDDLLMILPALRSVLRRYREQVEFQLVGVAAEAGLDELFAGLPVRFLSPGDAFRYPDFVLWMQRHLRWHFAIAPLCDTPFNRAKSDLKFLDYAMLGIPGLFSRVAPYQDTVQDGITGLLVEADHSVWIAALECMIQEAPLRQRLRAAALAYVQANRLLDQGATVWRQAIERALH